MPGPIKSYCGSCSQAVDSENYGRLVRGETVELACGHSNELEQVSTLLRNEEKAFRAAPELKRSTWWVLSLDPNLKDAIGPDCEKPDEYLPLRRHDAAWDAYWSGDLRRSATEWPAPMYLYELKAYRFMDFHPNLMQGSNPDFDTKEFEGAKFISRDYDPSSLGITVRRSFVRFVNCTEVTAADAPEGSVYGTGETEK